VSTGNVIELRGPGRPSDPDVDAEIDLHAAYVLAARRRRHMIEPLSRSLPLTRHSAERMRNTTLNYRLASGERCAGWRMGSASGMTPDGVHDHEQRPSFGMVTEQTLSRHRIPSGLCQPTVYADIALTVGTEFGSGSDERTVIGSIAEARLALSVVESVFDDGESRGHTLNDAIAADSMSPSCVVIGDPIPIERLERTSLLLDHNGRALARTQWRPATTSLARDLIWLVEQLSSIGQEIAAGQLILLGWSWIATPAPGDQILTSAGRSTNVSCYYPTSPPPVELAGHHDPLRRRP
jgi:2-keto-4-pentenoate hydratase